ncbi:MAG: restriction endonuclease [Desulfobulbaceae bacterium]|nr:restriction endonuclease [Desulfobulbaceae bacterium]
MADLILGILFWAMVIMWLNDIWGDIVWLVIGGCIFIFVVIKGFFFLKDHLRPCSHGIKRAFNNHQLCNKCVAEVEKRKAEYVANEKRRIKAERDKRAQEHRQYIQNIRLPSFLKKIDPLDFEKLACDLHSRMGYTVESTPYTGDSGADGILKKNGDITILQAKRVQGSVGEPILRDLYGTMHSFKAQYGVVVTTGKVSRQAREWVKNKPIRLIELDELSSLIRQYYPEDEVVPANFVTPANQSNLCPKCYLPLRKRRGPYGKFYGCTGYPKCKYTRKFQ